MRGDVIDKLMPKEKELITKATEERSGQEQGTLRVQQECPRIQSFLTSKKKLKKEVTVNRNHKVNP